MSEGGLRGMEQAVSAAQTENNEIREKELDAVYRLEQFGNHAAALMMHIMPVVNELVALQQEWGGIVQHVVDSDTAGRSVPQGYLGALTGSDPEVLQGVSNGLAIAQNKHVDAIRAMDPVARNLAAVGSYLAEAVRLLDTSNMDGGQIADGGQKVQNLLDAAVDSRDTADRITNEYMHRIFGK